MEISFKTDGFSVAFSGQLYEENAVGATYIWPAGHSTTWREKLSTDPAPVLNKLSNPQTNEGCYTIWLNPDGVGYAFRKRLLSRPGNTGMAMVLVPGYPTDGKYLAKTLRELLEVAESKESQNDIPIEIIEQKISCLAPVIKEFSFNDSIKNPIGEHYWTYRNEDELAQLLERIPFQSEILNYTCIHLLHESDKSEKIHQTASRIPRKIYFVAPYPDSVEVQKGEESNPTYVSEGDNIKVRYKKTDNGWQPSKWRNTNISKDNQKLYKIEDDNKVRFLPADEVNDVKFAREIKVDVFSPSISSGKHPIDDWQWSLDKDRKPQPKQQVLLPEGKHTITIYANGYKEQTIDVDTAQNRNVEVTLEPESFSHSVFLKPAWENGWSKRLGKKGRSAPTKYDVKVSCTQQTFFNKYIKEKGKRTFYISTSPARLPLIAVAILSLTIGFFAGHFLWPKTERPPIEALDPNDVPITVTKNGEKDLLAYLSDNKEIWVLDSIRKCKNGDFFCDTLLINSGRDLAEDIRKCRIVDLKDHHKEWKKYISCYELAKTSNVLDDFNHVKDQLAKLVMKDENIVWSKITWNPDSHPNGVKKKEEKTTGTTSSTSCSGIQ